MKNFMQTKMQELTVGQTFLFLLLYMIFFVVVWAAMFMVPQHCSEIWDWCENLLDKVKAKIVRKKSSEFEEFEDSYEY